MAKKPTLSDFNEILSHIAERLVVVAGQAAKKKTWKSVCIDERAGSDDDDSRIGKLRIVLEDGSVIKSIHTPRDIKDLIQKAWEIKRTAFPKKWYGLRLAVQPNGKSEAEFDYDPHCVDDETFFES